MAAAEGELAETRSSLIRRLLARLAPEVGFARGHEVRVALAQAMVMAAGADPKLARLSAMREGRPGCARSTVSTGPSASCAARR